MCRFFFGPASNYIFAYWLHALLYYLCASRQNIKACIFILIKFLHGYYRLYRPTIASNPRRV